MKQESPRIVVLYGGVSSEREVSLVSGECVYNALKGRYDAELIDVTERMLPLINPENLIVFPVFHGEFGEDGEVQALLEKLGICYVGCDALSSALCMDKGRTKERVQGTGWSLAPSLCFTYKDKPTADTIIRELGSFNLVLKPNEGGSTINLSFISSKEGLEGALKSIDFGTWIVEKRIIGRECTIGMIGDQPGGIVEIVPKSGVYDYASKYSAGSTEYLFPAKISEGLVEEIGQFSKEAFYACSCRDFARIDFILDEENKPYFLEINTIPGFTPTSLLPKSASCLGYDFPRLLDKLVEPAIKRFHKEKLQSAYV